MYTCEYCIKVASYTGFQLKCIHVTSSSQLKLKVKLAVTSNIALALRLHVHETSKFYLHTAKIFSTLPNGENKTHKNPNAKISRPNFLNLWYRYIKYSSTLTGISAMMIYVNNNNNR